MHNADNTKALHYKVKIMQLLQTDEAIWALHLLLKLLALKDFALNNS